MNGALIVRVEKNVLSVGGHPPGHVPLAADVVERCVRRDRRRLGGVGVPPEVALSGQ